MTTEEKHELIRAICGYLPYKLQVKSPHLGGPDYATGIDTETGELQVLYNGYTDDIEKFKLYLRPISSMTSAERGEFKAIGTEFIDDWSKAKNSSERWRCTFKKSANEVEWLFSHYFDFMDLIEKGLALEAPCDMYR